MLLEDSHALRHFLYLILLGKIYDKEDPSGYHWLLEWDRDDEKEIIWLTPAWNRDTDTARRSKPEIFHAAHGFGIIKHSQESGRSNRIESRDVRRYLEATMTL